MVHFPHGDTAWVVRQESQADSSGFLAIVRLHLVLTGPVERTNHDQLKILSRGRNISATEVIPDDHLNHLFRSILIDC